MLTERFYASEQLICPVCRKIIQAKIVLTKRVLKKCCLEHGQFNAILSSDIDFWLKSLSYTKPGAKPLA